MGRTLVIGAPGQLGQDVVDAFTAAGDTVLGLGHSELDVTDATSTADVIAAARPDVIVNTAAFHHLDRCEADPATAFAVNATGAWNVARAAAATGAQLVHVSTDYVFDGTKGEPYTEADLPAPLNVYGASKLAGEHLVLAAHPVATVVRVAALYGPHPCRAKGGRNFPDLMVHLARERGELTVVTDEVVSPTYTPDLARQIVALVAARVSGVIHVAGAGETSWHGLAVETLRLAGLESVEVRPATAATMVRPVRRPARSPLARVRLANLGLDRMRPWQEALAEHVQAAQRTS